MLTPHCSAASRTVVPPPIGSPTPLRKSAEHGLAIRAGRLPAGSLNHIRAAMGIPDSAFPGNALNAAFLLAFDVAFWHDIERAEQCASPCAKHAARACLLQRRVV